MFRIFDKINNNEVYIIAEMSANHGGSLQNTLRIDFNLKVKSCNILLLLMH